MDRTARGLGLFSPPTSNQTWFDTQESALAEFDAIWEQPYTQGPPPPKTASTFSLPSMDEVKTWLNDHQFVVYATAAALLVLALRGRRR